MAPADDDRYLLKREFDDFIEDQWKPFVATNTTQHLAVRDEIRGIGTSIAVGVAVKAAEDKLTAEKLAINQTGRMVIPTWAAVFVALGSLATTIFGLWKATGH